MALNYGRPGLRLSGGLGPPPGGHAREARVDELDHRAALADGSCAALERAGADVAGGVDPGTRRLA